MVTAVRVSKTLPKMLNLTLKCYLAVTAILLNLIDVSANNISELEHVTIDNSFNESVIQPDDLWNTTANFGEVLNVTHWLQSSPHNSSDFDKEEEEAELNSNPESAPLDNITNMDYGKVSSKSEVISDNDTNLYYENETCVGDVEYCNYTKEEYIIMINAYIFPKPVEWVLIVSHSLVFTVGLVGNALVCFAVYTNHTMRTVTNYFIVNLAVADFMVILFCLPPTVVWDVTETWYMGEAMCKIVLYFQNVSVAVSVLTLTFISIDRWYAICFPLRFKSTTGRAQTAIIVIWVLSILLDLPELVVLTIIPGREMRFGLTYFTQCAPTWSNEKDLAWHVAKLVALYTLPLLFMSVAYYQIVRVLWRSDTIPGHRESRKLSTNLRHPPNMSANPSTVGQLRARRKAAKMLVAVVGMFAICYFPVHVLSIFRYTTVLPANEITAFMSLFSHWLCYANSAVNPVIYNFMSGKFRREFQRAFYRCHFRRCRENFDAQDARQSLYNAPYTYNHSHVSNIHTSHSRNTTLGMYRMRQPISPSPTTEYRVPLTTTTSFINDNGTARECRDVTNVGQAEP